LRHIWTKVRAYGTHLIAVDISKPQVFVGGLLGAMLVFLFAAMATRAVGTAAGYVIEEVRRQFASIRYPAGHRATLLPAVRRHRDRRGVEADGTARVCSSSVCRLSWVLVFKQLGIGAETVAAFLMVGTIAGILMATVLNNSGWGLGQLQKIHRNGRPRVAKAQRPTKRQWWGIRLAIPFKDTAGPSLHVVIKLLSTITLVLAPLFL
jgi:K(+)-stimulated pyrophosphate-energized sodium pump